MITWLKGMAPLSGVTHFALKEFECPCRHDSCVTQLIQAELLFSLEQVRVEYGKPIRITSGYRCAAYQADLKARGYETAKGRSPHEDGAGADIQPVDMLEVALLEQIVLKYFKAVGTGRTFLHVDTRADKVRRWSYILR